MLQGIPVYDTTMQQNGISMNVGTPLGVQYTTRFGTPQVGGYAVPSSQWVPSYMMAQPIAPVDEQVLFHYWFLIFRFTVLIFFVFRCKRTVYLRNKKSV